MSNELDPNRDNEEAPVSNVANDEAITGRSNDDEEGFEDADDVDADEDADVDADEAGIED